MVCAISLVSCGDARGRCQLRRIQQLRNSEVPVRGNSVSQRPQHATKARSPSGLCQSVFLLRLGIDPDTLEVRFKVIGQSGWSDTVPPDQLQARGICGSGIIEAVAEMFTAGILRDDGRFVKNLDSPRHIRLDNLDAFVIATADQSASGLPVVVSQKDVRMIQLAKAALYVSAQLLMRSLGIAQVDRIVLAGAFGSVIDPRYAMTIGMIPDCDLERVSTAGNAAGDGARIALLNKLQRAEARRVARWVEHVDQPLEDQFQRLFMAALGLPHSTDPFPHLERLIGRKS